MSEARPYRISKHLVVKAFQLVKANHGAAGVDGQSVVAFEEDLKGNLYKVWNRMSSGSYLPPPVRLVEIPKGDGPMRPLGIPSRCLHVVERSLTNALVKWAMRKHKRFRGHWLRAYQWLGRVAARNGNLFAHWSLGERLPAGR